ncbi:MULTISPECIES: hypothetical protein [Moorena]|uniref:Uncharacterized protein n=1 Tax=Moorena producens 3L TaxID=489825 RepID=F4XRF5_9CYAN|nr:MULTISPECIES: hypothetical protein [Moorena]NEQ14928.1 hypothetical protein [Moorena sp. SIO3E2]NES45314.1 hypothetical protein [Moorena sp. SIO2C4]EGJ32798.1 hypothetical protein LYNGBM3L_75960 [Moorena producens 3L]NEP34918.1 hypothetical protein [Moorena sp. SIO3B2]NER87318.1 hypothetical protein [Moorena sp. SIO3A2]
MASIAQKALPRRVQHFGQIWHDSGHKAPVAGWQNYPLQIKALAKRPRYANTIQALALI